MKVRSEALYLYLKSCGALNGSPQDIIAAKQAYRREYKRRNKQNRIIKPIELRPGFTPKQYRELYIASKKLGLTPTSFIKQLALQSIDAGVLIPRKDVLREVLKNICKANNSAISLRLDRPIHSGSLIAQLEEAEKFLSDYLNSY